MEIKPNIRSNFGPLSPRGFNKIAAKANERTTQDATKDKASGTTIFLAIITGSVQIIANRRWKYTWGMAVLKSSTKKFEGKSSVIAYPTNGIYAYNACEALQQEGGAVYNGPGVAHANIPTGFFLVPIADGTGVLMLQTRDDLGDVSFVFSLSNAINGSCA